MRKVVWVLSIALGCAVVQAGCDTERNASMYRVSEGVELVNRGNPLGAVHRFEEAVALDPDNAQAQYYLGLVRLQEYGDAAEAVVSLERATQLAPGNADYFYQFGVALERLDRPEEALAAYSAAIENDPEHAEALFRIGRLHQDAGQIQDAIDDYTRSIYANPRLPWAYNALGNLYFQYGRPQEAIQVFLNAIENNPDDTHNRADLGRVHMSMGEYDLAITYLRQAEERDARSSALAFNLGMAFRARYDAEGDPEDLDAAIERLRRARSLCNPANERARCDSIAATLRQLERANDDEGAR